jgi:hypothetical protein
MTGDNRYSLVVMPGCLNKAYIQCSCVRIAVTWSNSTGNLTDPPTLPPDLEYSAAWNAGNNQGFLGYNMTGGHTLQFFYGYFKPGERKVGPKIVSNLVHIQLAPISTWVHILEFGNVR